MSLATVAELRRFLKDHGLPTSGNKATLQARIARATHQDYFREGEDLVIGIPGEPERGTCPLPYDAATFEEFAPGDVVRRLRNTDDTVSNCYHDRTLKHYIETTMRNDGPHGEDMSSLQWPTHSDTWGVPGNGDTVI